MFDILWQICGRGCQYEEGPEECHDQVKTIGLVFEKVKVNRVIEYHCSIVSDFKANLQPMQHVRVYTSISPDAFAPMEAFDTMLNNLHRPTVYFFTQPFYELSQQFYYNVIILVSHETV